MPSAGCSSRVPLLPIWWQPRQAPFFSEPDVLRLALEVRVDPVPLRAGAGELALGRDLEQRVPVPGRVVLRRGARIRRGGRPQVQRRPGLRPPLRRVDQPVPAHPDVVARLRQVGEEVAPLVVGHHDLGELRREVGGLGDHPHPRLGAARPRHHPRDVVAIDRRSRRGRAARRACRPPRAARRPPPSPPRRVPSSSSSASSLDDVPPASPRRAGRRARSVLHVAAVGLRLRDRDGVPREAGVERGADVVRRPRDVLGAWTTACCRWRRRTAAPPAGR